MLQQNTAIEYLLLQDVQPALVRKKIKTSLQITDGCSTFNLASCYRMHKNSLEIQTTCGLILTKLLLNAAQQNISEVQLGWDAGVAPANAGGSVMHKNTGNCGMQHLRSLTPLMSIHYNVNYREKK